MNIKRVILQYISELVSFFGVSFGSHNGFRVLMYHSVNSSNNHQQSTMPNDIFAVDHILFKEQMLALSGSNKYSVVSFSDGCKNIHSDRLTISVTFDDGFKDNLHIAAPILVDLGIPFTVFITSEFINQPGYLNDNEVLELSHLPGVEIGCHGATHTPLTDLDNVDLENELKFSKHYIEDIIGDKIILISYPHGAVNSRVINAVNDAGYKIGAGSRFGINNNVLNYLALRRTVILAYDSKRNFIQKLNGYWDWYDWVKKHPLESL